MKTTLAILVAALPFSVSALPLYVQYEGIVVPTNAPLRAGYNIGDRISGTLVIDSVLAPRTNVQPHNGFAYYAWPGPQGTDFVTGWVTGDNTARDFVILDVGRGPAVGWNSIGIADADEHRSLFLHARHALVTTLDLVQTFDIQLDEPSDEVTGFFEWGRESVEQVFFMMTRFSMTPGRCRP